MMRNARQLREAKGLSLRDVEARIGIDHSTIGKFESANAMLRGKNLIAYARLLETTIDSLLMQSDLAEPAGGQTRVLDDDGEYDGQPEGNDP